MARCFISSLDLPIFKHKCEKVWRQHILPELFLKQLIRFDERFSKNSKLVICLVRVPMDFCTRLHVANISSLSLALTLRMNINLSHTL